MSHMDLEYLVGKHVVRALVSEGDVYLDCADGAIRLRPEGDCASCFIAGVTLADALTDATVMSIEDLEFSSSGDDTVVDVFGHRIHTTRGTCTVDMRTEHNGYYSGRLYVDADVSIPTDAKPLEDF